jgi:hypothetical protein
VAIRLLGVLCKTQRKLVNEDMFPTSPSLFASTAIVALGTILTLGFQLIWLIFAATLIVSMLVAVHRSIPRAER